ncbi:MAG: hypothetical protein QOE51_2481 [Actinoplanes sp.]|nr:hypothetical protein [Actinoplanes sp.]
MSAFQRTTAAVDVPAARGLHLPRLPADRFARRSESVARFFGTPRYLVLQTGLVMLWLALNIAPALRLVRWDPYPFTFLNLAFSTQAAYAAPFILLAQNRQADRDRVQLDAERAEDRRQHETTDYISRELADLRLAHGTTANRDYIRAEVARQLAELREAIRQDVRHELACTHP